MCFFFQIPKEADLRSLMLCFREEKQTIDESLLDVLFVPTQMYPSPTVSIIHIGNDTTPHEFPISTFMTNDNYNISIV